MSVEAAIWSLITDDTRFTDLAGTRLYPIRLPQDPVYPCVSYRRVSSQQDVGHDGSGDFESLRVQFDVYARGFEAARLLASTLRTMLNGFRGSVDGVRLWGVLFLNEFDGWGDAVDVYRITTDYRVMWQVAE